MNKKMLLFLLVIPIGFLFAAGSVPYEYKGKAVRSISKSYTGKIVNGITPVWDFNKGMQNNFGGYGNPFVAQGSTISVSFDKGIKRGQNGKALKLIANKTRDGWCGYWFHLFDMKKSQRQYVDMTPYSHLSFFIKGENGGEELNFKIADNIWEKKEDSVVVGRISDYVKGGKISSTEWREVLIPVSAMSKVDIKNMALFSFEFSGKGKQTVYIDDITFKTQKNLEVPIYGDVFQETTVASIKPYNKAMWVWHPLNYQNTNAMKQLVKFCNDKGVNILFLQTLMNYYRVEANGEMVELTDDDLLKNKGLNVIGKFKDPDADKRFLEYAHKNGIKEVHVLDGYKIYVLEPYHPKMLAQVQATIDENNKDNNRLNDWDGVHHDNEPHLVPEFQDKSKRENILVQFLDLSRKTMDLIKKNNAKLLYGVDIPFWYDEPDEQLNYVGAVKYNGVTKPMDFHLLDMIDNIGIMDYRNFAYGPDGTIAHAKDEIEYADKVNKKIYVGLETLEIDPAKITFYGMSEAELDEVLMQTAESFQGNPGFDGFAIHYYESYMELIKYPFVDYRNLK